MKRTINCLLAAGVIVLAALMTSCRPGREDVPSARAEVLSAAVTSANVKLETNLLISYSYLVVESGAEVTDDPVLIFTEGTSGTLVNGSNEVLIEGLDGECDYTAVFAFKQSETSYYPEILRVDLTTGEYTDPVTLIATYPDGFKVHFKIPAEVKEKGNALRFAMGNQVMYNMNKVGWFASLDTDLLLMNGQMCAVNDTTILWNSENVYARDENGELIPDEWTGEPVQIHNIFTPGEPMVLMLGEFAWDESDSMGWGMNGYYTSTFDINGYYDYLDQNGGGGGGWGPMSAEIVDDEASEEDPFWKGYFCRKLFRLPEPAPLDCEVKIEADIKATTGTLKITPDENVWQYCMLFLPDDEYQQLLPFVGGDESLLQWFTASFLAAMQFGAQTLEGPVEFALEDSYYLQEDTDYHVLLTALGNENGTAQKFYHEIFHSGSKSLPAPEVRVTAIANPSGAESPYEVWFNVKCTSQNAVGGIYAANYDSEWGKLLGYNSLTDITSMGNAFTASEIAEINSAKGLDMMFTTIPGRVTSLGVILTNEEDTGNEVVDGESFASVTAINEPAKTPVSSSLFTDLLGDWTMSAQVDTIDFYDNNKWKHAGSQSCNISIVEGFTMPETLADSVYTIYQDLVGMGKDAVDALYADLKKEVAEFNANVKSQNRLLCVGFGFDKANSYDPLFTLRTPYDLFVSKTYNGYDNYSIVYDCGPKWYLEVLADGSLVVPCNAARQMPMALASSYLYLGTLSESGYLVNWTDNTDLQVPCTVASDKNSFTIDAFKFTNKNNVEESAYLNGLLNYYGQIYGADYINVSPLTLTKNSGVAATAAKSAAAAQSAAAVKSAAAPALKPMLVQSVRTDSTIPAVRAHRKTGFHADPEAKPVYKQIKLKPVTMEEVKAKLQKQNESRLQQYESRR